ncbi:MAG: Si-specific NAD(P)(+) transhydrogenase [Chloroflexota bacterium]|nr:Si-specific NAD(P)(+) transhydrogenase [Chloroflexota bacterium]MDE2945671.1 Si-specific NAD(P)(+) transhydrogenase [Chloroflexota bacterium]
MMSEIVASAKPAINGKPQPEPAPKPRRYDYDIVIIGSGPAGHRAAIQSAKLGKRVAVIEKKTLIGGVSVNTGTIPSKTLREAVLHLSGFRQRSIYGASYTVKENITMNDLLLRADHVIRHEIEINRHQLQRNGVQLFAGIATIVNEHTVHLNFVGQKGEDELTTRCIMIAVGTTVAKPAGIPFDGETIFTSDGLLKLDQLPKTLTVVGGGVIGCEYACMFATLGTRVTLVEMSERLLAFVDHEIVDALVYHMRQQRVTLRLGENVRSIEKVKTRYGSGVKTRLDSGKEIVTEKALYAIGRQGATAELGLENIGIVTDKRGRIAVNEHYQTKIPSIYAVGDVVGFPSLASTSMEQGRMAACHAFGIEHQSIPELFPYGIYAIPEISTVGANEEELTRAGIPYEIGKAYYKEIARGQIIGDTIGMLKLVFHRENHKLLGVHIIGEGASELIHIGQTVMAFGGTVDYFINTVFNYPTLAECYKTAAFDGVNRLI